MELTLQQKDLYRAMGELAYAIAKSDKVLSKEEREAFLMVIDQDLGRESWLAKDRFEMLENQLIQTNIEKTYNHVMYLLKINKDALTGDIVKKFKDVVNSIAQATVQMTEEEKSLLNRFHQDLNAIVGL